jgi:5-(carboxyamino)imidazole ribonucleotide mutase
MLEVGIILGSESDLPKVKRCLEIFELFDIGFEIVISSAHRSPDATLGWAAAASERGIKVIIAVAGGAAHLPGVVASHTILPVIGVPVETNIAGGLDSLLSIVQMPEGVPVAAMAVGKAGGGNAALYAISILALSNSAHAERLVGYRKEMANSLKRKNENLIKTGYKKLIRKLEG